MSGDNLFERRSTQLTAIMKRRLDFGRKFFGVGERPPWTHKLNRTEQRQYFWSQPDEKKMEMWGQMDADERDVILGNDKPTGEEKARQGVGDIP